MKALMALSRPRLMPLVKSKYKEYILTVEDYGLLAEAAKGKIVGKWEHNGQTTEGKSERLLYAWFKLGMKYCFDPFSVLPLTYNKILAYSLNEEECNGLRTAPNV